MKPDGKWRGPSLSRGGTHKIWFGPDPDCCVGHAHCNCPDHLVNQNKCAHIHAVEALLRDDPRIKALTASKKPIEFSRPPRKQHHGTGRGTPRQNGKILEFDALSYDLCQLISPKLVAELIHRKGRPLLGALQSILTNARPGRGVPSDQASGRRLPRLCDT